MKNLIKSPVFILLILLLVSNFISDGFQDPLFWLEDKLMLLPAIVIGLSFHEFAHGWASHLLGDPTPKLQGRLTLNPLKHFDLFGFIALMVAGFGWGIPVEIDPRYYKHPRRDELIVSLAGVAMNFLIAVVFALILKVIFMFDYNFGSEGISAILIEIITYIIEINVVLMVFNLLPIPPLDGFGIITQIFDLRKYSWYAPLYENGFTILLVLLLIGGVDKIIGYPIMWIYNMLIGIIVA